MLLALLMLVGGRLGGPLGMLAALVLDTVLAIGALAGPSASGWTFERSDGAGLNRRGGPPGGALARPLSVGVAPSAGGGGGVPETDRGIDFGGGGVAFLVSVASAPAFLLTQRLRSGS